MALEKVITALGARTQPSPSGLCGTLGLPAQTVQRGRMRPGKTCLLAAVAVAASCLLFSVASWAQDSEAPDDPRAAVEAALKEIVAYEFSDSRQHLNVVEDAVRGSQSNPKFRKELVKKLTAVLQGEATLAAKDFVCRQLALIGTEEAVPVLGAMLKAEETSDMARYALEGMPYPAVDKVLLDALDKTSGAMKIGVVNSLGERRCGAAVTPLGRLVQHEDPAVARAAAMALGKIGGKGAAEVLARAAGKVAPEVAPVLQHLELLRADGLRAEGRKDEALAVYDSLLKGTVPGHLRAAAFLGKVTILGEDGVAMVADALVSDDVELVGVAATCVRWMPGQAATNAFTGQLPNMSPEGRVVLLTALADRGDPSALPMVMKFADSENAEVRIAASEVIGKLGDAGAIEPLARVAATTTDRTERQTARDALDSLKGADVNATMLTLAKASEPAVRMELIRSLAARHAVSAKPDLLHAAGDVQEESGIRVAAFKALAKLATADELPQLIGLLPKSGRAGKWAERAVIVAAKKIDDEERRVQVMLDSLAEAEDPATKCSLYTVLGQLGDAAYLDVLLAAFKEGDPREKNAAMRALAGWTNVMALDDLMALVEEAESKTHRVLALRGVLRLLRSSTELTLEETLAHYKKAMDMAQSAEEKRLLLGGLSETDSLLALPLVSTCLGEAGLGEEAALAAHRILFSRCVVMASHGKASALNAIDLNLDSRWCTGEPQAQMMSFVIDLGAEYDVSKVILDNTPSPNDFPRAYQVFVTNDPADWHNPVAEGEGSGPVTKVALPVKRGRYVVFILTASDEQAPWSIHEVKFADPEAGELGIAPVHEPTGDKA